jgi:hypothetical protein
MSSISLKIRRALHVARRPALAVLFGLFVAAGVTAMVARVHGVRHEPLAENDFLVVPSGGAFYEHDDWLGSRHVADSYLYFKKYYRKKLYAQVVCHTDELGRRRTVQERENWTRFAIFAPCSFSFGDGVLDEETLPSQFARQVAGDGIAVYNYGVNAWGPNNLLALLTDPRFPAGIPEKRGFLIYSFIDPHVNRAIAQRSFLAANRNYSCPHYVVARDGTLRRKGLVSAAHPAYDSIWEIVADRLGLIGTFYRDWPERLKPEHFLLTARLIAESQAEFAKLFDAQGFFVVFYPSCAIVESMKPALDRYHVRYLDYTDATPCDRFTGSVYLQPDGHPTAATYRVIAARLAADLAELGVIKQATVNREQLSVSGRK